MDKKAQMLLTELEQARTLISQLEQRVKESNRLNASLQRLVIQCRNGPRKRQSSQEQLLQIFPVELWSKILTHIRDANDQRNCYSVSKVWAELLIPYKTSFLFPKVFPILLQNQNWLNLNCRLVCRSWKDGVDNYLQSHGIQFFKQLYAHSKDKSFFRCTVLDQNSKFDERFEFTLTKSYSFTHNSDIGRFLRHLEKYTGDNPFINRCIYLHDNYDRGNPTWWNIYVPILLQRYGDQVWHFSLIMDQTETLANIYLNIVKCLNAMPNLRTIKLFTRRAESIPYSSQCELDKCEKILASNPFPELRHLVKLKCRNVPYPLFQKLLSAYSHIKILEIYELLGSGYLVAADIPLPKLEQVEIYSTSIDDIMLLESVNWPLQKLNVWFHQWEPSRDFLKKIFDTANHYSKTLRYLKLKLLLLTRQRVYIEEMEESNEPPELLKLHLPHLKGLTLDAVDSLFTFSSIDFIVPLFSLKNLVISLDNTNMPNKECHADSSAIVKLFTNCPEDSPGCSTMYDSNIWQLLPNLKQLKLNFYPLNFNCMCHCFNQSLNYSREEYYKYEREKCILEVFEQLRGRR